MCGISGVFDFSGAPADRDLVTRMCRSIAHRGPDGEGYYVAGAVGLGHRRLSIIDLEGGAQPICNETGRMQIIFNGEIYNFIELREELEKKGHIFKTRSDTEVILHGYEEWGLDCVSRLNGIFAFAIWDGDARRLFLARDHLGVKPLYYSIAGNRFLFASEIKALLQDSECSRDINLSSLGELFTLRYVPSPNTLIERIHKLPPAHSMIVSARGVKVQRYWNWTPQLRAATDEASLVEEYRALLEDAVRIQMRSDVPVGLFLSSGVDSAALLALMSQHTSDPVRTFTIGFENGEDTNETNDARKMARQFGAEHEEMIVTSEDYRKYYERYLWDVEEPVGNETAAAFYFVSYIASKKVKVALTGQGADEPWAGYHRYIGARYSELYGRLPKRLTRGILDPLVTRFVRNEQLRRGVKSLDEPDMLARLVKVYSFYSADMKAELFKPWLLEHISADGIEARNALRRLQADVAGMDALTQMIYIDTRANLPDDLLMVGDKTAMANSLEARVPFLDYRVVEFAESLPPHLKLRGFQRKYLHKKAIEKWVSRDVVYRKKKGFANPIDQWLRSHMRGFVRDCLMSDSSAATKYFRREYIEQILSEHESGRRNYLRHIYQLISFEMWHQKFISA
jgi:asparagine synthase (glutamine-hydrolysing)